MESGGEGEEDSDQEGGGRTVMVATLAALTMLIFASLVGPGSPGRITFCALFPVSDQQIVVF